MKKGKMKHERKTKKVKAVNGTLIKSNILTQKPGFMYFVKDGNVYELKCKRK